MKVHIGVSFCSNRGGVTELLLSLFLFLLPIQNICSCRIWLACSLCCLYKHSHDMRWEGDSWIRDRRNKVGGKNKKFQFSSIQWNVIFFVFFERIEHQSPGNDKLWFWPQSAHHRPPNRFLLLSPLPYPELKSTIYYVIFDAHSFGVWNNSAK